MPHLLSFALLFACAIAGSVLLPNLSPRRQWDNAQGYCGETSIQTSALYVGAWLSQAVVRAAGGGSEILVCNEPKDCNVAGALDKLGLAFELFADNALPTPQPAAFIALVKAHLDAGRPAIQCIYVNGGSDSDYDHIVPIVGYEDSSGDASAQSQRRNASAQGQRLTFFDLEESTPEKCIFNVDFDSFINTRAGCNRGSAEYCLPSKRDFAVSVTGPADPNGELARGVQVRVLVARWDEPNVSAKKPEPPATMFANVSLSGLTSGAQYSLLRYNRVGVPTSGFSCGGADRCGCGVANVATVCRGPAFKSPRPPPPHTLFPRPPQVHKYYRIGGHDAFR